MFAPSLLSRLAGAYNGPVRAQPVPQPRWLACNLSLAQELGLEPDFFNQPQHLALLAGNVENQPEYHASVYSGHQFGVWAGQLGDGRAVSLGALAGPNGEVELQLKGAGLTDYSRHGDGRAVLRSSIREYLASEAMHALGVPTSRALSLVAAPLPVLREGVETAAILCRSAASFIRIGHFEHWAAHALRSGDHLPLAQLTQACIAHYAPECAAAKEPVLAFLAQVAARNAALVAHWQAIGFCHGVMNTDNISILGLTLDYGPYQFMDAFDQDHICNASDTQGRYRYSRQPAVMRWNLFCLAQALLPLLSQQQAESDARDGLIAVLEGFEPAYQAAYQGHMAAKLGVTQLNPELNAALARLLTLLHQHRMDWTVFWRQWAEAINHSPGLPQVGDFAALERHWQHAGRAAWQDWLSATWPHLAAAWAAAGAATARQSSLQHNPLYVLRNHLAQATIAAAEAGDGQALHDLASVLRQPYTEQAGASHYAEAAPAWAKNLSISCSS